jgi:hypothetical protein
MNVFCPKFRSAAHTTTTSKRTRKPRSLELPKVVFGAVSNGAERAARGEGDRAGALERTGVGVSLAGEILTCFPSSVLLDDFELVLAMAGFLAAEGGVAYGDGAGLADSDFEEPPLAFSIATAWTDFCCSPRTTGAAALPDLGRLF